MTIAQIIGLVVVFVLAVLGGYFIIRKSKKYDLAKWIGLFLCVAISLTWIFSFGYFNGTQVVDYGMVYQGITDIPNLLYYTLSMASDKIIYLLALGAFYAVLSKCDGYKKLVVTIAEKLKGKEITFALVASLLFTAMSSMFTQTFVTLLFVPFVVSILLSMKLDKITAFCVTFGSVLIGTLGATYGSEGLDWFNYYTEATVSTGIIYRLIILVVAFILFNFFTVLHAKKVLNGKKVNELDSDPFKVENVNKKAKVWPTITILSVLLVLVILGYVNWEANFGIKVFSKFHEWLIGLKIGEFAMFKSILGTGAASFGTWNLLVLSILLLLVTICFAVLNGLKLNDFIESYGEGFKKISKGILLFLGSYMVMLAIFDANSGVSVMSTITNLMFKNIETFNPFLVTIDALLSNAFHVNFGLTGYSSAAYLMTTFASNLETIHTIFTTMYGFVSLCVPTSAVLLIGLSYLDIEYKTWMKYIWMFVVAILVILLVLFTVMTYI